MTSKSPPILSVGIDVGLDGAVAIIGPDLSTQVLCVKTVRVKSGRTYDEAWLVDFVECQLDQGAHFWIEQPPRGSGDPSRLYGVLMLQFGYGLWRGIIRACGDAGSYDTVRPQLWQTSVISKALDKVPGDTKASSLNASRRLYPDATLRHSTRCTVDNHNMSDALLIAEYGRRVMLFRG